MLLFISASAAWLKPAAADAAKKKHTGIPLSDQFIVFNGRHLDDGRTLAVVGSQVEAALRGLDAASARRIVVAYEPVWAIGTGRVATRAQAQEVHGQIRSLLREIGLPADDVPLLYGGSVKPDNIDGLMAEPDIDGALVGGASLEVEGFARIVEYRA